MTKTYCHESCSFTSEIFTAGNGHSRSGSDGQLSGVSISNIGHLEGVVDSGDAINTELPHSDERKDVADVGEDSNADVANVPVDDVADEVSRLCHIKL